MQCAGFVQRREELRCELQLFASRLGTDVVQPALEEHGKRLRCDMLEPALAELRSQLRKDFSEEISSLRLEAGCMSRTSTPRYGRDEQQFPESGQGMAPLSRRYHASTARSIIREFKAGRPQSPPPPADDVDSCCVLSDLEHESTHQAPLLSREPTTKVEAVTPFQAALHRRANDDSHLWVLTEGGGSDAEQQTRRKADSRLSAALLLALHPRFDYIVCFVIVLNILVVGLETDVVAKYQTTDLLLFRFVDLLFCLFFAMELFLRAHAHRLKLLTPRNVGWTAFESCLLVCQILDVGLAFCNHMVVFANLSFLRIMRLLRMFRVARVVRVFHLVIELRTILSSILGSMKAIFWVVVLYLVLVYTAGTFFTQVVAESRAVQPLFHVQARQLRGGGAHSSTAALGSNEQQQLDVFYGTLGTTILSLWECVSGGTDWKSMLDPLWPVSPLLSMIFLAYVIFGSIAMMNVVTGIFVEHAMRHAEEDQDIYVAKNVIGFFQKSDLSEQGEITMATWEEKMDCPELQALFRAVSVDPCDARSLFRLIDLNGNGTLDPDELIDGWVRLRGQAKSLDLALLMRETDRGHQAMQKALRGLQEGQARLAARLEGLAAAGGRDSPSSSPGPSPRESTPRSGAAAAARRRVSVRSAPRDSIVSLADMGEVEAAFLRHQTEDSSPFDADDKDKPFRAGIRPLRRSVAQH